jgi:hypothetical protein
MYIFPPKSPSMLYAKVKKALSLLDNEQNKDNGNKETTN